MQMDDRQPTPLYITVTLDMGRKNEKLLNGLMDYDRAHPGRIQARVNADYTKMQVRLPWKWAKELYARM